MQVDKSWHWIFKKNYTSFVWVCWIPWLCINKDAKVPKQVSDTLVKMYSTNAEVYKMEFKKKLHNLQKKLNIDDYFMNVKNLVDVLASIGIHEDDDDLVLVTFKNW